MSLYFVTVSQKSRDQRSLGQRVPRYQKLVQVGPVAWFQGQAICHAPVSGSLHLCTELHLQCRLATAITCCMVPTQHYCVVMPDFV